jgi:hypothetical protein
LWASKWIEWRDEKDAMVELREMENKMKRE